MEIRSGWSTDYGHTKFDVTVNDTDLQAMLVDEGFDTDISALTLTEKFKLMKGEADRYSVFAALEHAVMSREQAVPKLEAAAKQRADRLKAIQKRLAAKSD